MDVNKFSDDLSSHSKLFADDGSVFSVVYDKNLTTKDPNDVSGDIRVRIPQKLDVVVF